LEVEWVGHDATGFQFDFVMRTNLNKYTFNAAQLRYNYFMKTAILPSVRVDPALRASVESLLEAGETLSGFVENAVRQTVMRRQNQAEFVARGLMSLENAKRTGEYVDSDDVVKKLAQKLAAAKSKLQAPKQ
jgi:predicted transcriptional regulator